MNRNWIYALIVPCLTIGVCLLGAEITLRFMPVYMGLRVQNVSKEQPLFRFKANRHFNWSIGWRFLNSNEGHTNNAGFVNDQNYDANGAGPLLAVVGDSYIEALMVPYSDTLQGRLQAEVGASGRVYSFAASGAPLSQYMAWARNARDVYRPDGLVVVVVGNDFDESLAVYKQGPGFHHFFETSDGDLVLRVVPYRRGWVSRIAAGSALFYYLVNHLHALELMGNLRALLKHLQVIVQTDGKNGAPEYVGNTAAKATKRRLQLSKRAVDKFLEMLPSESGLPPSRILIVVDAIRGSIYYPERAVANDKSYFAEMRRYLMERGRMRGIAIVDLQGPMTEAFLRDGRKFEWQFDSHWNAHGHEVVAEAVSKTPLFRSLFPIRP